MTNTPMTFEEWWNDLFKHLQNDSVWSRDELHNLATMSWQACEQQNQAVIAELVEALDIAKDILEAHTLMHVYDALLAKLRG